MDFKRDMKRIGDGLCLLCLYIVMGSLIGSVGLAFVSLPALMAWNLAYSAFGLSITTSIIIGVAVELVVVGAVLSLIFQEKRDWPPPE